MLESILFKGLAHELTWTQDSLALSFRARDIWGETELSGCRMRAGGAIFSQTEVLAEVTFPFLSPSPKQLVRGSILETPSVWFTLFAPLW